MSAHHGRGKNLLSDQRNGSMQLRAKDSLRNKDSVRVKSSRMLKPQQRFKMGDTLNRIFSQDNRSSASNYNVWNYKDRFARNSTIPTS